MGIKFGTGGVRAVMGEKKNQMNQETIILLTQAVAEYVKEITVKEEKKEARVVICYDSRVNSKEFADITARILWQQGNRVFLGEEPLPTPFLSFSVRSLKAEVGISITASHNPKEYNGYKVYGKDGGQITKEEADRIQELLIPYCKNKETALNDWKECLEKEEKTEITPIPGWVRKEYENAIFSCMGGRKKKGEDELFSVNDCTRQKEQEAEKELSIIYTPLHGTGAALIPSLLEKGGFKKLILVEEQREPDGNFPTCPLPNPEEPAAMELGLAYCEKEKADLLLATDPDSDRIGVAAKGQKGYEILNGNQVGILLLEYLLRKKKQQGTMPANPIVVKTIVTTSMVEKITAEYQIELRQTLTGFKYIGEIIKELEEKGREKDFLFGMEESCGYLTGNFVRDKDAVSTALWICEMAEEYKKRGMTLWQGLELLYEKYGNYENRLESQTTSLEQVEAYMKDLRRIRKEEREPRWKGKKILRFLDYREEETGLPKSDILRIWLEDHTMVTIRPSGTEPKIKFYYEKQKKKS